MASALKKLLQNQCPDVVLMQETKREHFDNSFIKLLWSSKEIGWSFVESLGKSGDIIIMWYERKISVVEFLQGGYSLSVKCSSHCKKVFWVINV